jgi:hypothetical protein
VRFITLIIPGREATLQVAGRRTLKGWKPSHA